MKLFRKIGKRLIPDAQYGYSQFGEDLILAHLFAQIGIDKPTYLDIGANEPRYISNTYYFYLKGSRGVLVEPNPYLYRKLKILRPNDTVLNTGIGISNSTEADFYLFPNYANGLSTFSEKEAKHWQEVGMKGLGKIPIEKVLKIPLIKINDILQLYFKTKIPNFISIDIEGFDFEILKTFDFTSYQPEVFCIETLAYDEMQQGYKTKDTIDFMLSKGYDVYADTRVNTIFSRTGIFVK